MNLKTSEKIFEQALLKRVKEMPKYEKRYEKLTESLMNESPLGKNKMVSKSYLYEFYRSLDSFEKEFGIEELNLHTKTQKQIHESYGTVADLGILPRIGHQFLLTFFGTNPMQYIAYIQNVESPSGLVRFKDLVAISTRGNVTAGQKLRSSDSKPDVFALNWSNSKNVNETAFTGDGSTVTFNFTLAQKPVKPFSVNFTWNGMASNMVLRDNGEGLLYSISGVHADGTINYDTGVCQLVFDVAPANTLAFKVEYVTLFEADGSIPLMQTLYRTKNVNCIEKAMGSKLGYIEKATHKKLFNVDLDIEMIKAMNSELQQQIVNEMVYNYVNAVPAGNDTIFDANPVGFTGEKFLQRQNIDFAIRTAKKKISKGLGRGGVSFMIAGYDASVYVENKVGFKAEKNPDAGTAYIGMYNETIPTLVSNIVPDNKIILGHKSDEDFDAPGTHAIFLGLANYMPTDPDNVMQVRGIAAQVCSVDVNVPKALASVTINNIETA